MSDQPVFKIVCPEPHGELSKSLIQFTDTEGNVHTEIDLEKAYKRCVLGMEDIEYIEPSDTRTVFELHLQHIHAALDGDKEDLYNE